MQNNSPMENNLVHFIIQAIILLYLIINETIKIKYKDYANDHK